jgi:Mn2+/Fe2+ NRAMP family transporter
MTKLSKIIRVVTVAPLMALLMLLILGSGDASFFGGLLHFLLAVIFLTIFPVLAYPLQPFFPSFKDKGRGQRTLANYFAVGLIGGCVSPNPPGAGGCMRIYLSYGSRGSCHAGEKGSSPSSGHAWA